MRGVKFGDYHTYDDFSLYLVSYKIGTPTAKTSSLSIEGADGNIDTTNALSDITRFNNRKLSFAFSKFMTYQEYCDFYSLVMNKIHGRKVDIVLDDDTEHYYYGRINATITRDNSVCTVEVECDCQPYKCCFEDYINEVDVTSSTHENTINYSNHMPTMLEINVDKACDFKFIKNYTQQVSLIEDFVAITDIYHLTVGDNLIPIAITNGTHAYQFIKTGTDNINATITLKRGDL